jgi:hypothetical protein
MLGFGDVWVTLAFLTCLGSTALCVVWGLAKWNEAPSPNEDE